MGNVRGTFATRRGRSGERSTAFVVRFRRPRFCRRRRSLAERRRGDLGRVARKNSSLSSMLTVFPFRVKEKSAFSSEKRNFSPQNPHNATFALRSRPVRAPFALRSRPVRVPFASRSRPVRVPVASRSRPVRVPFALRSRSFGGLRTVRKAGERRGKRGATRRRRDVAGAEGRVAKERVIFSTAFWARRFWARFRRFRRSGRRRRDRR